MAVYSSSTREDGKSLYHGPCKECGTKVSYTEKGKNRIKAKCSSVTENFLLLDGEVVGYRVGYPVNHAAYWFYLCTACLSVRRRGRRTQ